MVPFSIIFVGEFCVTIYNAISVCFMISYLTASEEDLNLHPRLCT